jgi:hypothetical protein
MCSVSLSREMRARRWESARGCNGEHMRKTLLLVGILMVTGTARAQAAIGGSINNLGSISSGGSLNGAAGMNAGALTTGSVPSAPSVAGDSVVNQNSTNPGPFVPSTFTSYGQAVELGKLEAAMKPITLAEAARLAREQKKSASAKPAVVLEKNEDGKLVIAPTAKP